MGVMGDSPENLTLAWKDLSVYRKKKTQTRYLMLNGRLAGADLIARISGFVPQEDLSIEDLTVDEHMEFM
ncbi:Bm-ok protein, partial [Operophtera brumata]